MTLQLICGECVGFLRVLYLIQQKKHKNNNRKSTKYRINLTAMHSMQTKSMLYAIL